MLSKLLPSDPVRLPPRLPLRPVRHPLRGPRMPCACSRLLLLLHMFAPCASCDYQTHGIFWLFSVWLKYLFFRGNLAFASDVRPQLHAAPGVCPLGHHSASMSVTESRPLCTGRVENRPCGQHVPPADSAWRRACLVPEQTSLVASLLKTSHSFQLSALTHEFF